MCNICSICPKHAIYVLKICSIHSYNELYMFKICSMCSFQSMYVFKNCYTLRFDVRAERNVERRGRSAATDCADNGSALRVFLALEDRRKE